MPGIASMQLLILQLECLEWNLVWYAGMLMPPGMPVLVLVCWYASMPGMPPITTHIFFNYY